MEHKRGYFDIDADFEELVELGHSSLEEVILVKDMQQRKVWLNEGICMENVSGIIHNIYQYNREDVGIEADNRKPILLYLSSNGPPAQRLRTRQNSTVALKQKSSSMFLRTAN